MSLQKIREDKNFSRKELAEAIGISYRTIQDYEQGHKQLSGARAATVYKLSVALGCNVEDLIEDEIITIDEKKENDCSKYNELTVEEIERERIYISKFKINARWKFIDNFCYIEFLYKGKIVMLPFNAVFNKYTLKWLKAGVELKIEDYIEDIEFNNRFAIQGEALWDE